MLLCDRPNDRGVASPPVRTHRFQCAFARFRPHNDYQLALIRSVKRLQTQHFTRPPDSLRNRDRALIYLYGHPAQTGGPQNSTYGVLYSFEDSLKPFASLVVIWSGKVGTEVGILGQGFNSATGVNFGKGPGSFTVVSDTYMIASPANGATTGNVTVLAPSGNLVTPQVFKVIPSILSFTPSSGPVGTSVTIKGTSFLETTSVTFGGAKATSFTVDSDTQITAVVPTGAKTGTIGITTKGGKAVSKTKFTVQ